MSRRKDPKIHGSTRTGRFTMDAGQEVFGALTFAGPETYLRLDHDSYFNLPSDQSSGNGHFDVLGELLETRQKVSLLSCLPALSSGSHSGQGIKTTYYAEVEPSIVMVGNQHLSSREKVVAKIYFQVDDAGELFYDHRTFGVLVDSRPFISKIANANIEYLAKKNEVKAKERIPTGDDPIITYYTGCTEIFCVDTSLGKITAENHPVRPWFGTPDGVAIKNTIYVTISFPDPVATQECFWRAIALLRFLELCAGRPQNVLDVRILTTKGEHDFLEVYWPRRPSRKRDGEITEKPWSGEILLDPVRRHDEYVRVLAQWLGRHKGWEEARMHFITCMHDQLVYGPARITAAANMFDLMPASAVPPVPKKKRYNPLKTNILHRANIITENAPGHFPELEMVIGEAVKCRNRYVHARQGTIEYRDHFRILIFLTETLEFIFAASDLVECGWSLKDWLEQKLGGDHPFHRFAYNYQRELGYLKKIVAENKLPMDDAEVKD